MQSKIIGSEAELRAQQRFFEASGSANAMWDELDNGFTHQDVWLYVQGIPGPTDPGDPALVKAWAHGLAICLAIVAVEQERINRKDIAP